MTGLDPSVLVAALTGSSIFTTLLPPLADVRRSGVDSATGRDVRTGIAAASAALVGTGIVIGFAERSSKPVLMTVALAGVMGVVYEMVLRQPEDRASEPLSAPVTAGRWGT